jgi:hypothetical protein
MGGPCFPRDNLALAELARQLGVPPDLAQAVDRINRLQIHWLVSLVQSRAKGPVGILGLTHKPGTDVVEEAVGFLLAQELADRNVKVLAYDPAFGKNSAAIMDERIRFAATAGDASTSRTLSSWPPPGPSGRVTTSKPHRVESFKLSRDAKLRRAGAYKCINEALLTSLSSAPESSHGCHAGLIGAIA